jgi:hypothetical protein
VSEARPVVQEHRASARRARSTRSRRHLSVIDDRGARIELFGTLDEFNPPITRAENRAKMQAANTPEARARRWLFTGVMSVIAIACVGYFITQIVRGTLPSAGSFTFGAIAFGVSTCVLGMRRTWHRRQWMRHPDGLVAPALIRDTCPGCDYTLAGAVPEADGCSLCPECGAAWNLALWKRDFQEPDLKRLAEAAKQLYAAKLFITDARGWGAPFLERRDRFTVLDEVRERRLLWHWRTGLPVLVLIPILASLAVTIWAWGQDLLFAAIVFACIMLVLTTFLVREAITRATRKAAGVWARDFIALSVCPRCESPLRAEPARDGTTLCENCRHAWRNP